MIFKNFDPNNDVVAGRTSRVDSGFFPGGQPASSQSLFQDDFFSLATSVGNPSYGTSIYDIRRTMYYTNIFPDINSLNNNDPYFSVAYGNVNGSGSISQDYTSIFAYPTKAIYTQYSNMLLGSTFSDEQFTMYSGSTTISAPDIWVIDVSAYKMKDQLDQGLLEFTLSGSVSITFIDDSPFITQAQSVYQIIVGTLNNLPAAPTYQGIGLFYPGDGIIILNAAVVASMLGITSTFGPGTGGPAGNGGWPYNPGIITNEPYNYNHKTLAAALETSTATMKIRKSEYVPSSQYFVRVMNKDFNYSNNPTYVYDGTDGIHAKGTIYNTDFINNPTTYVTSVGLYNSDNELVAVGKLSRPLVKNFNSELLLQVRLDF